nr:hypothetical protein [uncultured Salipiger sp.]
MVVEPASIMIVSPSRTSDAVMPVKAGEAFTLHDALLPAFVEVAMRAGMGCRGPAMGAFQQAPALQIAHVAAHGFRGHTEARRELGNPDMGPELELEQDLLVPLVLLQAMLCARLLHP